MEEGTVFTCNKNEHKKLYSNDSENIFYEGYCFLKTAEKIRHMQFEYQGEMGNLIAPYIVNLSFAAELFLKSLLVSTRVQFKPTHDLYKLYSLINDDEIKDNIKSACYRLKDIDKSDIEFEKSLNDIREVFENWRYVYERMHIATAVSFIKDFAYAVMIEAEKHKIENERKG